MADAKKSSRFLEFALLFAIVYLVSNFAMQIFVPKAGPVGVTLKAPNVKGGHHPVLQVENHPMTIENADLGSRIRYWGCSAIHWTNREVACGRFAKKMSGPTVQLEDRCPLPPLDVFRVANPGTPQEQLTPLFSDQNAIECEPVTPIAPGETGQINLAPWKYSIFNDFGVYEVRLPSTVAAASGSTLTARFEHYEPGVFTKVFRTFITKPFLNFLIFSASLLPDYSLGISIIILTVLVKLLLFYPTQKAMQGQREMQKMQPKLEAIKEKHKGNPEVIQQETLKLWKEHKINPLSSCLPTLIQFPILIGLFYTIRDGSVLALSKHLIYPMYQHLDWTFGTNFLGLDLLKPDPFIVPIALVLLQFIQMKLAFHIARKKKEANESKESKEGKESKTSSPQDIQQKIMMYGLPLMIGFFALKFPAAVSIYWGVSTLFGIGQQIVVNRKSP